VPVDRSETTLADTGREPDLYVVQFPEPEVSQDFFCRRVYLDGLFDLISFWKQFNGGCKIVV
jgi:hypothetical protein